MNSFCRKLPPVLESFKPTAKETTCRSGAEVGATEADRSKSCQDTREQAKRQESTSERQGDKRQRSHKEQATPRNKTWTHLLSGTSQKRDKRSPQPNGPKSLLSKDSTTSSSSKTELSASGKGSILKGFRTPSQMSCTCLRLFGLDCNSLTRGVRLLDVPSHLSLNETSN